MFSIPKDISITILFIEFTLKINYLHILLEKKIFNNQKIYLNVDVFKKSIDQSVSLFLDLRTW